MKNKKTYLLAFLLLIAMYGSSLLDASAMDTQELKAFPWQREEVISQGYKTVLKGNVQEKAETVRQETGIGVIGLRFIHQSGFPSFIEQVYPNSPASRAGIMTRDLIFAIDGVRTDKLNSDGVYQLLAGSPGSTVRVFITRGQSMFNVEMSREDLVNFPVDIQNRYLAGPVIMPVGNEYFNSH